MNHWHRLRGRRVAVQAAGVMHRGTVVELGEECLVLRSEGGFREIPWDTIVRIEEEGSSRGSTGGGPRGPLPEGWGE